MSSNPEQTIAEAKSTIDKLEATLRESEATMSRRRADLEESGLTRETMEKVAQTLDPKQRQTLAEDKQKVLDEIERDLPKQATRKPRLKPTRQMV